RTTSRPPSSKRYQCAIGPLAGDGSMQPSVREKIRDPELRGQLGEEGRSENILSYLLLETTRQLFMNPQSWTTYKMRNRTPPLLWSQDVSVSKVRIIR